MDETKEEQPGLVKKSHCKSGLELFWPSVKRRRCSNKREGRYRACNKTVLIKGGNTSNMLTHLHDHHPELYAEAQPICS